MNTVHRVSREPQEAIGYVRFVKDDPQDTAPKSPKAVNSSFRRLLRNGTYMVLSTTGIFGVLAALRSQNPVRSVPLVSWPGSAGKVDPCPPTPGLSTSHFSCAEGNAARPCQPLILPSRTLDSEVAICASIRDSYDISGWLHHHRERGVGAFYLYDFSATNPFGHQDYGNLHAGDLRYEHVGRIVGNQSPQLAVRNACIQHFAANHNWMAFVDANAYLMTTDPHASIPQALIPFASHGAVSVDRVLEPGRNATEGSSVIDAHGCFAPDDECEPELLVANTKFLACATDVAAQPFIYRVDGHATDVQANNLQLADRGKGLANVESLSWFSVLPQGHSHTSDGVDDVKTLVILYGQPRGSDYAWKSIHKHMLRPLNAHLATYFTDEYPRTMLEDMARYSWTTHAEKDWGGAFEQIAKTCRSDEDWKKIYTLKGRFVGGIAEANQRAMGSLLLVFKWLIQQKVVELGLDKKYDYMLLSRADQLHVCDHSPMSLVNDNFVNFPRGGEWGGWPDRHIFAATPTFMKAINMTTELLCNAEHWYDAIKESDCPEINPECLQKIIWEGTGLNVTRLERRTMMTVKAPEDPASLNGGNRFALTQPFGLLVKSPVEMEMVLNNCTDDIGFVDELTSLKTYDWRVRGTLGR